MDQVQREFQDNQFPPTEEELYADSEDEVEEGDENDENDQQKKFKEKAKVRLHLQTRMTGDMVDGNGYNYSSVDRISV